MKVPLAIVVGVVGGVLASGLLQGQSLVELAAQEKQRRTKAKPGKVYTERDLGRYTEAPGETTASIPSPAATPATAGAGRSTAAKEKTAEELQAEQQAAWREQVQKAEQEISAIEQEIAALQTGLNNLSQNVYGSARTRSLNQLQQAQQRLAEARQRVEALQEEGRRSRFR